MVIAQATDMGGTTTTPEEDEQLVREAIGSGEITTTVDTETGDATQAITGQGSGYTAPAEQEDDVTAAVSSPSTTVAEQTAVEQEIEDATGGRAFLDPTKQDTISDRETWNTTDEPASNSGRGGDGAFGETAGIPWMQVGLAGAIAYVVYKVFIA